MPNASAPKAPWVAVWLSPQTMVMPGWVSPSSGPMTWTMPRLGEPWPWNGMPNSRQFSAIWASCFAGQLVEDRQRGIERGDRVIGRGDGLARPADLEAALAQAGECLRAGHLVDEVQIDREDSRRAGVGRRHVVVPDLLDEGARSLGHVQLAIRLPASKCTGRSRLPDRVKSGSPGADPDRPAASRGSSRATAGAARLRGAGPASDPPTPARRCGAGGCRATTGRPGSRNGPARSARSDWPCPSTPGRGPPGREPARRSRRARAGRPRSP